MVHETAHRKTKQNNRRVGTRYEQIAADYLKRNGLYIRECNFRCDSGEIDLIARDGTYLVFVEVKYRKYEIRGDAAEAVNRRKQKKIIAVAKYYLTRNGFRLDTPCRFDVVAINDGEITWFQNAFEV